jgi:hypothetical protein
MIVGIEGGLGSGKTILMTRYLVKDNLLNKHKIYSNYKLEKVEYEIIDLTKILDMHKNSFNLNNCSIGIDEITVFADCRKSGSKMNRLISYFILQSRKRDVNIYFTTQNLQMIDFRLANYMDFQVICEKIHDKDGNDIEGYAKYRIFDIRDIKNIKIVRFVMDLKKYYRFYDTNEVILPPI